jgi:hypothetical protein
MTTWNYRVLVHTHSRNGERLNRPYYAVHEVYYDEAMTPHICTTEPVRVGGDSPTDIERQLSVMLVDIERPPIDFARIAKASVEGEVVDDEEDNMEFMQAVWGDPPSAPYEPTSAAHCAWEVFGRSGKVPQASHIEDLVAVRQELCEAMDALSSLRASRRRRSWLHRLRIVISRMFDRMGL